MPTGQESVQTSSQLVNPQFYLSSFSGNGDFQGRLLSFIPHPRLALQQCEECSFCWFKSRNLILSETRWLKRQVPGKCKRGRTAQRANPTEAHACTHEQSTTWRLRCWSTFSSFIFIAFFLNRVMGRIISQHTASPNNIPDRHTLHKHLLLGSDTYVNIQHLLKPILQYS